MANLPARGEVGPFSLGFQGGLPSNLHPQGGRDIEEIRVFTERVRSMMSQPHQTQVIGSVATTLIVGEHRTIPPTVHIEPVPPHGVTFHNPDVLLGIPAHSLNRTVQAMQDLVITSALVDPARLPRL